MKKFLIGLFSVILAASIYAESNGPGYVSMGINATNMLATTTNATAGTVIPISAQQSPIRIYVSATGTSSTTGGSLIVKLSTASGAEKTTNSFDTASSSNIKLVMSNDLTSVTVPVVVSDWFVVDGAKYLRVGQVENTYAGNVSNITVTVGFPQK